MGSRTASLFLNGTELGDCNTEVCFNTLILDLPFPTQKGALCYKSEQELGCDETLQSEMRKLLIFFYYYFFIFPNKFCPGLFNSCLPLKFPESQYTFASGTVSPLRGFHKT